MKVAYLGLAALYPFGVVLNELKTTCGNLVFVQFAVQMWHPCVDEPKQFVGTILWNAKPEFWP